MRYEICLFQKKTAVCHRQAIDEYFKRLSRYCKISIAQVKKPADWQRRWMAESDPVLVLPGPGSVSSEDFSREIGCWEMSGRGKTVFFIPDTAVLANWCRTAVDESPNLSLLHLSDFDMDPGLTAVVLSEQIYRGYRILNHHPYHK